MAKTKAKIQAITSPEPQEKLHLLFIFLFCVVGLWLISWLFLAVFFPFPDNSGEFGDMFGAVNSLFSGLTFAGIGYSIVLQRREIKMQRNQVSLTYKESKKQNKNLKRQRFENTFFQMLSLHHQIVNNIKYEYTDRLLIKTTYQGRDLFYKVKEDYSVALKKKFPHTDPQDITILELSATVKEIFNENYQDALSHYFRNLYHIYKFVYTSSMISQSEKQTYADIVTAQLSVNELVIVMYHCIVEEYGFPKFYFLLREFKALRSISSRSLIHEVHLKLFYEINLDRNPFMKNTANSV
jgi:hypothetical protein